MGFWQKIVKNIKKGIENIQNVFNKPEATNDKRIQELLKKAAGLLKKAAETKKSGLNKQNKYQIFQDTSIKKSTKDLGKYYASDIESTSAQEKGGELKEKLTAAFKEMKKKKDQKLKKTGNLTKGQRYNLKQRYYGHKTVLKEILGQDPGHSNPAPVTKEKTNLEKFTQAKKEADERRPQQQKELNAINISTTDNPGGQKPNLNAELREYYGDNFKKDIHPAPPVTPEELKAYYGNDPELKNIKNTVQKQQSKKAASTNPLHKPFVIKSKAPKGHSK